MSLFWKESKTKKPSTSSGVKTEARSEWVEIRVPMKKKNKDGTPKTYTKRVYKCKACGYKNAIKTRYCPDCGKRCRD